MTVFKNVLLSFFSLIFLLNSELAFASFYSEIHGYLIGGGGGYTRIKDTRNVWLAYTPEPGLENEFVTDVKRHQTKMVGTGFEKHFPKQIMNLDSALGLEIDYLSNNSLSGIVRPMINVAPDFDTLNFSYHFNSLSLYVTGKLSKQILLPNLGAYIQGGIGRTMNRLTRYSERFQNDTSAAPMIAPFGDGSNSNFGYFLGFGFSSKIQATQFSVGYRYVFSGSAEFKPSPIQQTVNTLHFSPVTHQFLVVSVMI